MWKRKKQKKKREWIESRGKKQMQEYEKKTRKQREKVGGETIVRWTDERETEREEG